MTKKITFQKTKSMKKRLKKLAVLALTLFSFNSHAQIDLVQTTNNDYNAGVATCYNGTITLGNENARLYNLTALGYGKFEVTKVSFGVNEFYLGSASNFTVSVKVYASTGGVLDANLSLVGEASIDIISSMVGTIIEVPFATPITVTSPEMLISVYSPDGTTTESGIFFGGSTLTDETATSYIKASACDLNVFTDIVDLGFTNKLILFPSGYPTLICPPGGVLVQSQEEANQFLIDYPNCTEINGDLLFQVNSGSSDIMDVSPFSNITSVSGSLQFNNNLELQNIDGLESLSYVGGGINMYNNGIQDIDVLSGLEALGGHIYIENNPTLVNLNGFSSLTEIGGGIFISGNTILSNISGLQNISPTWNDVEGSLIILNNPALEACNLPNFCTYLLNPANTHPRSISGNLGNCLNEEAVIGMCTLGLSEIENAQVNLYPNPVKDMLFVSNTLGINHVSVLNILGQTVVYQEVNEFETQVDMHSLSAGNYILKIASADKVETIKIIKE